MAKDFESLKQQALVIKNEVEDGANSSERVGGILEDMLDYNEEKRKELEEKIGSQTVEVDTELNEESQKPIANAPVTKGINKLKEQISTQLPAIEEAKENAIAEIGNKESDAIQNFSEQRVTPGMLSPETIQIINASGGGTINNLPDGETLAEIEMAEGLKAIGIPNRQPDTNLGYVILKKNKSLIEQITEANTIYEVRYSYDLGGETLTMPENCVLKFEGGLICNGVIVGNRTKIESQPLLIFKDLTFGDSGSFIVNNIYAEWWGVKSYTLSESEKNADYPIASQGNANVLSLPDCSDSFNSALSFNSRFGGKVVALGVLYHQTNTINILPECTLETDESTLFVVEMHGKGNIIITQDEDTSDFSKETMEHEAYFLKANQLIDTSCMKVAFEVSTRHTKFVGRGTIGLCKSDYTIGILVKHRFYEACDMSYFSPKLDIRTIGGSYNAHGVSSTSTIGDGEPTDDSINETGESKYYYDYSSKKIYVKKNNSSEWSYLYDNLNYFNTSIRFDVGQSGISDGRVIDPDITIGDMFGFRGIEIYTHDGGWFNIANYKGTISNKIGSFISIFTNYDANSHNFNDISCQVDTNMTWDARVFQAIRANSATVPGAADLSFLNPNIEYAFYLGKYTNRCKLNYVDKLSYVKDYGEGNIYKYNINKDDEQSVFSTTWVNVLDGKTPEQAGMIYKDVKTNLDSIYTSEEMNALLKKSITNDEDLDIRYLFDDDMSTSEKVIDIDEQRYGIEFGLCPVDKGGIGVSSITHPWVEIVYSIEGSNVGNYNNDFYVALCDIKLSGVSYYEKPLEYTTHSLSSGSSYYVNKIFIPIGIQKKDFLNISFFAKKEIPGVSLKVFAVKYLINSFNSDYGNNYSLWNNKNCIKKNKLVFTENGIGYNKGDAKNNNITLLQEIKSDSSEVIIPLRATSKNTGRIQIYSSVENGGTYELIGCENLEINVEYKGKVGKNGLLITVGASTDSEDVYYRIKLTGINKALFTEGCFYGCISDLSDIEDITITRSSSIEPVIFDKGDISSTFWDSESISVTGYDTSNDNGCDINLNYLKKCKKVELNRSFHVYGNIASLKKCTYIKIRSSESMDLIYNQKPYGHYFPESFDTLYIDGTTGLTSEMVDSLLIDLANSVKEATGGKTILIKSSNRSSNSDSAVSVLENLGFSISITKE